MIDVTIQMDAMGNLQIWKGKVQPHRVAKYVWVADGRECDLFVQDQSQKTTILDSLSESEFKEVSSGWHCYTVLEPEYF